MTTPLPTPKTPEASFWRLNLLVWIGIGIVVFAVRWVFQRDAGHAFLFTLFTESAGFGVSLLLHPLYIRLNFELRTAVMISALSFVAAFLLAFLAHLFAEVTGWHNLNHTKLENAMLRLGAMWIVFMGWSFGYFWLKAEGALRTTARVAEEAVREAQRMELRMLRAQLDPHFLFNSLNGITAEIPEHPDSAIEMTRELSDYLRYSLDHRKKSTGPLSDELDAMQAYLDIEKARFGDELSVTIDATPEARWAQVPSFLLQPLVENAIKHGQLHDGQPMEIAIRARTEGSRLSILVTNTGSLESGGLPHDGLGLDTLARRLDLHYPHRHEFALRSSGGVVAAELQLTGNPCSA